MTDSDTRTENWVPIPDARNYEGDLENGHIRSLARTVGGRDRPLTVLKERRDSDDYHIVNITLDDGTRKHGVSVARLILLAGDPDGYQPGMEACHGPNGKHDNSLKNLRWDWPDANRKEALEVRMRNNPPKPKPLKTCPRCQAQHGDKGQNCHACVVRLGVECAELLVAKVSLEEAGKRLDYNPVYLHNLAVKYGGLVCSIAPPPPPEGPVSYRGDPPSWLRRVIFGREASRANSDAP